MSKRFKKIVRSNGEIWFEDDKGLFRIVSFESPMYGFIIEYAESNDEGAFLAAEDGDQWPLLDYETPELMLQDMLSPGHIYCRTATATISMKMASISVDGLHVTTILTLFLTARQPT